MGGELVHNGEVVDALITMTCASGEASVSRDCFNPFPSNVSVTLKNGDYLNFMNKDQKNPTAVVFFICSIYRSLLVICS
jgi:predicted component of type VI protein secretion system